MTKRSIKKPLYGLTVATLLVLMLVGVLIATWFFTSSSLDMKYRPDQQVELLLSIE